MRKILRSFLQFIRDKLRISAIEAQILSSHQELNERLDKVQLAQLELKGINTQLLMQISDLSAAFDITRADFKSPKAKFSATSTNDDNSILLHSISYPDWYSSYPELTSEDVKNAKIYANRKELISSFDFLKNGKVVAEVGVLQGHFSEIIFDQLNPQEFVAFDLFNIDESDHPWATRMSEVFHGKTQLQFFLDRFKDKNIKIEKGFSDVMLAKYPDNYFDLIYIDGDHTYEGVEKDASIAIKKIKYDGILVFNDYILYDWNIPGFYGIVPVVNNLIKKHNFEVIGFAFERLAFCDIAIRRRR